MTSSGEILPINKRLANQTSPRACLERRNKKKENWAELKVNHVGIDNNTEEEKRRNHRSIKDTRNYVKNSNREKPQSHTQMHYLSERFQRRRRETSQPICTMVLTIV